MIAAKALLNIASLMVVLAAAGGSILQASRAWQDRLKADAAKALLARDRAELRQVQPPDPAGLSEPLATTRDGADPDRDLVSPDLQSAIALYVHRVQAAKAWFAANPAQHIPEMGALQECDWITFVGQADLDHDEGRRTLAAALRLKAEQRFAEQDLKAALVQYRAAHGDELPRAMEDLVPLLPAGAPAEALDRYELLVTGSATTPAATCQAIGLRPGSVVDAGQDAALWIGSSGGTVANYPSNAVLLSLARGEAQAAYANAHAGALESDDEKLAPYFRDSADAAAALEADRTRRAQAAARTSQ